MKIEIKESTDINIKILLHAQVSFANALRRILLGEVAVPAIDLVEVEENHTVLADEMLSHRLGLVPLRLNRKLVSKIECDCDSYCSRCSIKLTLCERNSGNRPRTITGRDLKPEIPGDVECHDSLLVKLAPGQKINLTCIARLGEPLSHVKYCPVTTVGFVYDPQNKLRETNLWFEEDHRKEWPNISQPDEREWDEAGVVEMDIEVVEGCGKPREILISALEILKTKMVEIFKELE
ncbi:DNA-directed RNA polymerase II subunit RPB3 [Pancytospora epiphaga]|nr:DNA-directed RNA polymerase II subunit RPB3 [Pancytospora epiphaga]